jgi:dipeptidyl aminopeptidase/acylaminoacyl peptidase
LLTRDFWESGQQLRLLDSEIAIDCPVRLIHGDSDREVSLDISIRTLRALRSADVQLKIIKGGGHRLSEPHEIEAILRTVAALIEHPLEPAR